MAIDLTRRLLDRLVTYPFPGNIRELRSMIFDAYSRSGGPGLDLTDFPSLQAPGPTPASRAAIPAATQTIYPHRLPTLEEAADQLTREALRRAGGNQTVAARMLGITRQGLAKRLKK